MSGVGHFPMWGKESKDDKAAAQRKKAAAAKKAKDKKPAASSKVRQLQMARGVAKIKEEEVKPTHFDIDVLKKCLKRFCASGGNVRSELRKLLLRDLNRTMKVFLDEHGE